MNNSFVETGAGTRAGTRVGAKAGPKVRLQDGAGPAKRETLSRKSFRQGEQ